jgi:hypothetical protein
MAQTTYFILQEFEIVRRQWAPKAPRQMQDRGAASRAVDHLRQMNKPGLAFARTGDPVTGEFDDAEVIASFNVPAGFMGEATDDR